MKSLNILSFYLLFLLGLMSCNFQRFDPIVTMQDSNNRMELLSISLKQDHNPDLYSDIPPVFNGNEITFFIPPDLDSTSDAFVLDFNIDGYNYVLLDSTVLESGITSHIFGHDTANTMTIRAVNGDSKEYTIRLIEEFHAFLLFQDPDAPAVPGIPQYNSNFPVYVLFNSPVDPASLTATDFVSDTGMSIQSDPVMVRDNILYKAELGSTTAPSGEYSLTLPAGSVANLSSGPNPPLNDNESTLDFIWDIDPPVFNQAGFQPLSKNTIFVSKAALDSRSYEDNYSAPEELRYRIFYNSRAEALPAELPPPLNSGNYNTDGIPGTDWIPFYSTLQQLELNSLPSDHYYNFVLAVMDKAGNIAFSNNVEAFLTSAIHVSASRGNDSTADGTKALPFANIQPAMDFAWRYGQNTVKVEVGIYYPDPDRTDRTKSIHLYPGIELKGGFESDFSGLSTTNRTILSGDINGELAGSYLRLTYSRHLIKDPEHISLDPGAEFKLTGFTLENGFSEYDNSVPDAGGGGAIYSKYNYTITDCIFRYNFTGKKGGAAIYIDNGARMNILNCTFYGNKTTGMIESFGGAIYAKDSSLTIEHSRFSSEGIFNWPVGSDGNIDITNRGYVDNSITSSTIIQGSNVAYYGGAVCVEESTSPSSSAKFASKWNLYYGNVSGQLAGVNDGGAALYLKGDGEYSSSNDFFRENTTSESGGGIYLSDASIVIEKDLFFKNTASGMSENAGGAIYSQNSSFQISSSSFFENKNSNGLGGAVAIDRLSDDSFFKRCIFDKNGIANLTNVTDKGGAVAIRNTGLSHPLSIYDCIFSGNEANIGSAIYVEGVNFAEKQDLNLYQSILMENRGGNLQQSASIYSTNSMIKIGYNLFYKNDNLYPGSTKALSLYSDTNSKVKVLNNIFFNTFDMTNSYFIINVGDIFTYSYNYFHSAINGAYVMTSSVTNVQGNIANQISSSNPELIRFQNITNLPKGDNEYFNENDSFIPIDGAGNIVDKAPNIPYYTDFYSPARDLSGRERVFGARWDIGPYEYQP